MSEPQLKIRDAASMFHPFATVCKSTENVTGRVGQEHGYAPSFHLAAKKIRSKETGKAVKEGVFPESIFDNKFC